MTPHAPAPGHPPTRTPICTHATPISFALLFRGSEPPEKQYERQERRRRRSAATQPGCSNIWVDVYSITPISEVLQFVAALCVPSALGVGDVAEPARHLDDQPPALELEIDACDVSTRGVTVDDLRAWSVEAGVADDAEE